MANETKNAVKVIGKDCTSEPRTVDKARSLEYFLVLIGNLLRAVGMIKGDVLRFRPCATLVDFKEFVGNILHARIDN